MNAGNIELVLFLFGSIGWKHFDLWNFGFFVVMEFPCVSVLIVLIRPGGHLLQKVLLIVQVTLFDS